MKETISRFRNSVAVACLLGLTWIFGFLAIDVAAVAFQVLFCVFNSLQGVFIFVFFAASQSDVRRTISTTIRGTSDGNSSNQQPNSSSTGGVRRRSQHSRGGGPNLPGVQSFDMFACTPPATSTSAEPPASGIHEDNMFRGNTPSPSTPQRDNPVGVRDDGIMLQHPPPPPTPPRG